MQQARHSYAGETAVGFITVGRFAGGLARFSLLKAVTLSGHHGCNAAALSVRAVVEVTTLRRSENSGSEKNRL